MTLQCSSFWWSSCWVNWEQITRIHFSKCLI